MSSSGIQLAELRAWAEREAAYQNSEEFNNWPVAAVLALVDAVEAAHGYVGTEPLAMLERRADEPHIGVCAPAKWTALVESLARFDFGAGVS